MFKINKFITLELRNGKTVIFLDNSEFAICMGASINTILRDLAYGSVDKTIEDLDMRSFVSLSPEEEYWVHCSNLQAWSENNYDTRLIHPDLSFPLLRELVQLGDPKALEVFKDELVKKFKSNHMPTVIFLLQGGYLDEFTDEEFEVLMTEVKEKIYTYEIDTQDKIVLDMVFEGEDYDEVPPLERFKPRAIQFLMEHPIINLFELLVKFGCYYLKAYYPWIFKFFGCLKKKEPELFKKKVELLLKKGYKLIPATVEYSENIGDYTFHDKRSDYSEMDEFAQVFYYRYLRDYNFKS
ncbi:MAG: hypothetical protein EAX91_01185 [Candidatus Lokiarchaeota archaeon]|nr:hypothetical protein [Candidatus Lokiarchaeota archaeon]